MVYTFISDRSIKLLSLSKTMLGQYHTAFFTKTHSVDLLKNGTIENVDLVASAVKEALTQATPSPIADKEIFLILPQEAFVFARYAIPGDISDAAILSFVKDKLRSDKGVDAESLLHDFIVTKTDEGCVVLFYGMDKAKFSQFDDAFRLLGLSVGNIIPETLAYFKLFNKTLNVQKQEKILFVHYEEGNSYGFVFDALGLLLEERLVLKDDVVESLRHEIETLQNKHQLTLNRLILSVPASKDIRQDFFTKDVGVWTNPLDKIIQNFYSEYVKLLLPSHGVQFSLHQFAVNLGGYIFECEKDQFQPLSPSGKVTISSNGRSGPRLNIPSFSFFSKRDIGIFLVSFLFSFGIIYAGSKFNTLAPIINQNKPIPTLAPTQDIEPTASPTPAINRDEIKVKILNGTGIRGKAAEYTDILKDMKYSEVLSGNAPSFDIEVTEAQVKASKSEAIDLIREDLKDVLTIEKTSELDESEAADVIIIIGLDSVTPSPTKSE